MNTIGTYISSVIEKGFRRFKFRRFGRDDIMSAYLGVSFGEDYIPTKGSKVVQIGTTNSNENVIICTVRKADDALNPGEKVIYSTDEDGEIKTKVYLRNDGTIEVQGDSVKVLNGEDYGVRYSKLESEFNELKGKYNDLVSKWNTFAAAYMPGGPATQGLPATVQTGSSSNADITIAKIENIRLP